MASECEGSGDPTSTCPSNPTSPPAAPPTTAPATSTTNNDTNSSSNDNNDNNDNNNNSSSSSSSCHTEKFVSASVAPSSMRPFDQVTVKCNYGKRLDCLSVSGAGLTNCRYSRYEGADNIFTCSAAASAGYYDDTKCNLKTGTSDKCCKASDKVGDMTVIGTEVHYDQDIVLPFGTYTLAARVFPVISKGKGVRVSLICNSTTCTSGHSKNDEISSISFPESADFINKSLSVALKGTGDDRHYLIRVSADKGSEAYFDSVSLKDKAKKELVVNGNFSNIVNGSVTTRQPVSWGEGDNKIGYYYGSVADEAASTDSSSGGTQTSGPTPTPGKASSMTLALKIKFQGITKKPAKADPITVQVKLAGTSISSISSADLTKSVQFTVDDAGVWSGTAGFNGIPTGGGYKVYIKGPKQLQKKICDAAPTESKGGLYHCGDGAIVLQAGTNTLDFSKIIQMGGDLPEAGGKQNGIVDAYDTTYIRTNLGSADTAKLAIGDLNWDGIIDTQDYSIILQSLSIKFDEE